MTDSQGICPNCGSPGAVGVPCSEAVCSRNGYHAIPEASYDVLPPSPRELLIGRLVGESLVVGLLGEGGFGKVFLALQTPLMMKAALKIMTRKGDDLASMKALGAKFEAEAKSLAVLDHPNIVRLYRYGTFEDTPYIVMEFVDGGRTLENEVWNRILRGERFDLPAIRHIIDQTLFALDNAHGRGIIHRDVKPENIMLQSVSGDDAFVRILDFGLAKFVDDGASSSMICGTPYYLAPEHITKRNVGPWTDLYLVGVLLFEFVTGRRPFPGKTMQELISMKLNPAFDLEERVRDLELSKDFILFFKRAIARDAEKRFQSVAEFKQAMDALFDSGLKLPLVDLNGLLDSNDIARLGTAHSRLIEDRKRFDLERAAFEREKRESRRGSTEDYLSDTLGQSVNRREAPLTPPDVAAPRPDPVPLPQPFTPPRHSRRTLFAVGLVAILALCALAVIGIAHLDVFTSRLDATFVSPSDLQPSPPPPSPSPSNEVVVKGVPFVRIPAGPFMMGCDPSRDTACKDDTLPYHEVFMDEYLIGKTEVTAGQYEACFADAKCSEPFTDKSLCTWKVNGKKNFPLNCVTWAQANDFCYWVGGALCTEAEWEKAGRGPKGFIFPWGDAPPTCLLTLMHESPDDDPALDGCGTGDLAPAGSIATNASPFGIYDLAGSLLEWTGDWYSSTAYKKNHSKNPKGAISGYAHTMRGSGFFETNVTSFKLYTRGDGVDTMHGYGVGFRCCMQPQ